MVTPLRTILSAGLLAGFLDGIAASAQAYLMRGMNPVNVFQYVAGGALGRSAFDGGWLTAGLRRRVSFGHRALVGSAVLLCVSVVSLSRNEPRPQRRRLRAFYMADDESTRCSDEPHSCSTVCAAEYCHRYVDPDRNGGNARCVYRS